MMLFICFSSAWSVDESSVAAMVKAMVDEQMAKHADQIAQLKDAMKTKDETIAALTTALDAKAEHKQVQLTTRGEVVQLVSVLAAATCASAPRTQTGRDYVCRAGDGTVCGR